MHPVRRTVADTTRRLVTRFYDQFWNGRHYEVADRLVAAHGVFRGTFGPVEHGPEGMVSYARRVRNAFPDLQMHVNELIVERDRAAARVSLTGTHEGEMFGCSGTGRHVRYDCMVLFRVARGRISEVQVHGDRGALQEQLHDADAPRSNPDTHSGAH